MLEALKASGRTLAIWLSGSLEFTVYIALYALKAFLPIYTLSMGMSIATAGLFSSGQEGVHLVLKPAGGQIGDRLGHFGAICAGMVLLGLTLPLGELRRDWFGPDGPGCASWLRTGAYFSMLSGAGRFADSTGTHWGWYGCHRHPQERRQSGRAGARRFINRLAGLHVHVLLNGLAAAHHGDVSLGVESSTAAEVVVPANALSATSEANTDSGERGASTIMVLPTIRLTGSYT